MQGTFGIFHSGGGGPTGLTAPTAISQLSDMGWVFDADLLEDGSIAQLRLTGLLTGTGSVQFFLYQGGSWSFADNPIADGTLVATSPVFTPNATVPITWTMDPVDLGSGLSRLRIAYQNLGPTSLSFSFYHALFFNEAAEPPIDTCGLPFFFDSARPLDAGKRLRLMFTRPVGPAYASPSYFTLTGTSGQTAPTVTMATFASDDSDVLDLYLSAPLPTGTYTVAVDPLVLSSSNHGLLAPYAFAFDWTPVAQEPIARGGENDDAEQRFLRNFNPHFRVRPKWQALAAGLAAADDLIAQDVQSAFDQLYIATASGKYLTRRAADEGVERPDGPGLTDTLFRQLAIAVKNDKLTAPSMLDVMEIFYGVDATHAFVETALSQPFVLEEDSTLHVLVDEKTEVRVQFEREQFRILRRASAEEVAAVITRSLELARTRAYAVAFTDPETDEVRVRIYSGSRGLASRLRVLGGTAQPVLEFQDNLFAVPEVDPTDFGTWDVTVPRTGVVRFDYTGTFFDFIDLQVGDYVVVRGIEFDPANRGWGPLTAVNYGAGAMWFEVESAGGVEQLDVVQCEYGDLELFRATLRDVYDNPTYATVTQHGGDGFATIAATTQAIERAEHFAAYLQSPTVIDGEELARDPFGYVTVNTSVPHGMSAGDWFFMDDAANGLGGPAATPGTPSGAYDGDNQAAGTSDSSQVTHFTTNATVEASYASVVRDAYGAMWVLGGWTNGTLFAPTELRTVNILNVVSVTEDADGTRSQEYRWFRGTDSDIRGVGAAHVGITLGISYGQILAAGGYTTNPWDEFADDFYVNEAVRYKRADAPANVAVEETDQTPDVLFTADRCAAEGLTTVIAGGSRQLNVPWATWETYDANIDRFNPGGDMVAARQMAQIAWLGGTEYLVIGGRQPFVDTRAQYAFTSWHFEDAEASPTFTGPVAVPVAIPGARRAGKAGHGAQLVSALTATAGAPQTALNAVLLGPWTITGWMTRGTGSVISNLKQPRAVQADNTLVHFGVDPADDLFFIRWQRGAGPTTETRKSTLTATELMPFVADPSVPRYYQFAVTKSVDGADATFTMYVNGRQVGQWTSGKPDGGSAGLWSFGRAVTGSVGAYTGVVDEVGISSEVLTADQVWHLYLDELGVAYDSPADLDHAPVGRVLSTCEVIDTAAGSTATGGMASARFAAGLCTLPDGRILVVGGVGYQGGHDPVETSQRLNELRGAELYNPAIGNWTRISDTVHPHSHCLAMLKGRRVYVAGGLSSTAVEYLDLDDMTWHLSAEPLPQLRIHSAAGYSGDDVMVVAGGGDPEPGADSYDWPSDALDMVGGPSGDRVSAGGINGLHQVLSVEGGAPPACAMIETSNEVDVLGDSTGPLYMETIVADLSAFVGIPNLTMTLTVHASLGEGGGFSLVTASTGGPDLGDHNDVVNDYGTLLTEVEVPEQGLPDPDPPEIQEVTGPTVEIANPGTSLQIHFSAQGGDLVEEGTATFRVYDATLEICPVGGGTSQTFTYRTPDHQFYTAAGGFTVMPVAAPDGEFDGPYTYETERGNGLSGTDGTTQDRLLKDHRYPLLSLGTGEGAAFPDEEGYLVIRSGYSNETGPIKYLGNTGDDTLILDAGFRFPFTIEPGATVTLVAQRGPYVPEHPERFGSFYVTDSPSGRVTCENLLFAISAAGIDLDVDVRYPGDRGLGGEGLPDRFARKLSDIVAVFGSNDLDRELERLRNGT